MEVRRLTELDAEALWHLRLHALESEPAAFGESVEEHRETSVDQLAERLRSGGDQSFVFGAIDQAELVGMIGLYREQRVKRSHRAGIWGMFIRETYRGTGTGRLLLDEAVRTAKNMPGVLAVGLSVNPEREPARRLYLSAGFRPYGIESRAYRIGDQYFDQEHMVLEL